MGLLGGAPRVGLASGTQRERKVQPQKQTYLTHDVLIIRKRQAQVGDVPVVALTQQRRGKCWDPGGYILEELNTPAHKVFLDRNCCGH